jgi:hypothetical protein
MAEKNSLWKNIRNKAAQNKRTGATPKKPSAEMLRQERKIKSKKAEGGTIGEEDNLLYRQPSIPMEEYQPELFDNSSISLRRSGSNKVNLHTPEYRKEISKRLNFNPYLNVITPTPNTYVYSGGVDADLNLLNKNNNRLSLTGGLGTGIVKHPGGSEYIGVEPSVGLSFTKKFNQGGPFNPDGGTYANKQGVIMGPVENPDGSYTLPVSNEGLPQVNLPEFEVALESNPYGPITFDEYLSSSFNPLQLLLPSVPEYQQQFRPDGTLIPASGRVDIDNTLPLAFMGAKPSYANFERGVTKLDLNNTHKLNPWAFKTDPNKFYRQIDNTTYKEGLQSGLIKGKQGIDKTQGEGIINLNKAFADDAYYNKGSLYYKDNKNLPYLYEANLPEEKFIPKVNGKTKKFTKENTSVRVSKEPISINDPFIKTYKKDWLQGYKPVKGYKADGGYIYNVGGPFGVTDEGNSVTLYNKTQYDPNQNKTISYVGSDDNKYYMMPGDTMIQGRLPEFEVVEQGIEKPKSYKSIFPKGLSERDAENTYSDFNDQYHDYSRKGNILRDTVIDLTNQKMGWFPFDAIPSEQYSSILGNNYIERIVGGTGSPEDFAKNWTTRMSNPEDTFRNKDYAEEARSYYHSKDIPAFYGIENGKFKVGNPQDFSENTMIVPVRNSTTPYSKVDYENGLLTDKLYTYDKTGNKTWNLDNKDKFIVYSPKTKKSFFRAQSNDMSFGKSKEEEISLAKTKKILEDFLKQNPDAYIIPIDEGRFRSYIANPSGVTENQFKNWNSKAGTALEHYLIQDPENTNTPINSPSGTGYGYNMGIIKQQAKGGHIYDTGGFVYDGVDFTGDDGSTKPKKDLQTAAPKPPVYTRENYLRDIQANTDKYFKDGTYVTPYTEITKPDEKNCINGICYLTRKLTNNALNIDYTSNPNFETDLNKNNFYRAKLEDGFEIGDILQYYTHKGSMLSGFPGKVTPVNSKDPWTQHAVSIIGKRIDDKGKTFFKIVNNRGTDIAKIEEISELDLMKRAQEGYNHYDGIVVNRYDPEKVQEFNRIKKENADIFSGKNSYAKEYDNAQYTGAFKPKDIYGKTLEESASSVEFRKIINELYPTLGKSSNMPKEDFDFLMNYLYGIGHQESNWGNSGMKEIKDAIPESLYPTLRGWSDSDKDDWRQDYWNSNANNVKNKYKSVDEFKKSTLNSNVDPEVTEYLRMHSPKSKGIFQQKELSERGRYFNYGFDDTKSQIASAAALLVDNYHKVKKKYPNKPDGELYQLAVLMHNSPSRALNPTYADYYPKRNDVDYFNKVKIKASQPQEIKQASPLVKSQTISKSEKEKILQFLNKTKSTGGNIYSNGGPIKYDDGGGIGEDGGTKVLNRDGLLIAPTLPEFEVEGVRSPGSGLPLASGKTEPTMGPVEAMLFAPAAGSMLSSTVPRIGSSLMTGLGRSLPGMSTVPGATFGNLLGAYGATDAMVNRIPYVPGQLARGEYGNAFANILTSGLDLYGANMVSPIAKVPGQFLREQVYNAVDPVGYGVREKLLNAPKTWARNTFKPSERVERVGKTFDPYGTYSKDDHIQFGKNRLDSWRIGLNLDQKYDTFRNLGNGTYRINAMKPDEDLLNDLYSDILASEVTKSGYHFGDDPLVNIANRNILAKARRTITNPKSFKSLYSSLANQTAPWQQNRIVETAKNPEFRHSIYDVDTQGIMGQYRWDVKKLDDGTLHYQSNDTWDINPWEKRGSVSLDHTTASPGYRKWNPFSNLEFLKLVGGKPFKIQNNFKVNPKTYEIIESYENGGPMQYKRGGDLEDVGKLLVNTIASPVEQISGNNFVNWNYDNKWAADAAAVSEGIVGAATDVTGSILLPGVYGQAKGAIQGVTGNIGNSTEYQRGANQWANTTGQIASSVGDLTAGIVGGDAKQIVSGSGQLLNTVGKETGVEELSMLGQAAGASSMFINPSQSTSSNDNSTILPDLGIPTESIVNQGMSFAAQGGHVNNEKYLVNSQTMKGRYSNYRNRYAKGGVIKDKLKANGIVKIPSYVGYHSEHPDGGQAMGKNASVERDELVQFAGGGHAGMGNPEYVYPADVDNTANTNPEEAIYMPKMTSDYKMITDKYGMPTFTDKSPAKWLEEKLAMRNSEFRVNVDGPTKESNNQAETVAKGGREVSLQANQLKEQLAQADAMRIAEEEYAAAYGGTISKRYKGLNMPRKAKGGYTYNAMTQPMLAHGGPVVSNIQQPFNGPAAQNRGGMMMANGGMMNPEEQMMQEQMMQQQQMQQQGGQDPMMQMVQQVAQAIMGGADPRKIMQDLMKSGMPEEQVQQIVQVAMQEIEGQQQGMQQQMAPQQGMAMGGRVAYDGGTPPEGIKKYEHEEPWMNYAAGFAQVVPSLYGIKKFSDLSKRTMNPSYSAPSKTSLENARIAAKEEGRGMLNAGLDKVRGVASNASQVFNTTRENISKYLKGIAPVISELYEREANTNAQFEQQSNLANQQASNAFKQLNEEMYQSGIQGIIDSSQEAGKMTGENLKSINRLRNQRMQIENMDTDNYIWVEDENGNPVKAVKSTDGKYRIMKK